MAVNLLLMQLIECTLKGQKTANNQTMLNSLEYFSFKFNTN